MARLLKFRRIKHAWPDEPLNLDVGSLRRSWLDQLSRLQFTVLVIVACVAMVSVVYGATDPQAKQLIRQTAADASKSITAWLRPPAKDVATVRLDRTRDQRTSPEDEDPQVVSTGRCHPSYSGCVPIVSDVDCEGGLGNGPYFSGPVLVVGRDVYGLDRDGDGKGCE